MRIFILIRFGCVLTGIVFLFLSDAAMSYDVLGQPAEAWVDEPAPPVILAGCMYGPNREIIHQPKGVDCGAVKSTEKSIKKGFTKPTATETGPWRPVEEGEERLYSLIVDYKETIGREDDDPTVRRFTGTRHHQIFSGPKDMAEGVVEERVTTRAATDGHDLPLSDLERYFVRPSKTAYEMVSFKRSWFGLTKTIKYDKPAAMLPEKIRKGVTWDIGSVRQNGITMTMSGEILGHQDAKTSAGRFKRCLVVKYTTIMTGKYDLVRKANVKIKSERTVWLARGVGPVIIKEENQQDYKVGNIPYSIVLKTQCALRGVRQQLAGKKKAKSKIQPAVG